MQSFRIERPFGAHTLTIETGKLAKQAHGAVTVQCGGTVALVAAVQGDPIPGRDFFPLTVDYRERTYAAGKFPGGFIKREGRPSTKEILTSRLIDRPIRPLFPAHYLNEVQVSAMALSSDKAIDADILSMIGASAALHLSPIPFLRPTGSVRIGRVGGELILMPTHSDLEDSDLDLIVSGTREAVAMIEGFARELPEDTVAEAILWGHKHVITVVDMIEELRRQVGLGEKEPYPEGEGNPLVEEFRTRYYDDFRARKQTAGKAERAEQIRQLVDQIKETYPTESANGQEPAYKSSQVSGALEKLEEKVVRDLILEGKRIDGRSTDALRDIECEVGVLPRTHGSAIFQRGETQAIVIATLGTTSDEQRVDGLQDEYSKKFMLDYNFPSFSVGECRPFRGPGRREIGHGALAERSLKAIIPAPEKFPYTIRLVSEILESNGSSSMASVCGGTLALMDAGVPITDPVAGISIGLVKEADRFTLLTDIMGDEDHFGDMDFKIAGTMRGVTGIQLDLKIDGIEEAIIRATLKQAREARRNILRSMLATLKQPNPQISEYAPRMETMQINPEKIGLLIGPGGKMIRSIQESTGAKIDVDDDGTVCITHATGTGALAARAKVEALTEEVKVGKVYEGTVSSVKDFGAFIEIVPGRDGLCHISELADKFVGKVDEVCKVGDKMQVKVIAIDEHDRIKLSRRVLLREAAGEPAEPEQAPSGRRSGEGGGGGRRRGG